ncbi:translation elongation factor Ts [Ferrovum myxofaciens]|jgi:elongation factor Ts|uniref:Elongation factor Ts n=2 Tax=root TaxID=1 RepID=A0A8F3DSJ9_9PROT|nr:translation elongation factor Ts [Ferrovum myxofaciens]MBW8028266.1 elongation factor Ts [Ferrovum sp.]KXW58581.1 elongation factor Ts [Ferrovum myxofaciens]MBU6994630.1 elongation factor Ts [Ferrovum myxofaciens]NDU88905.1 elongation factor Ts [Ferrovum sp.]QKE38487.1 MAG: elongation factor Ts [Ferrovum myxofaciens]
MAEITASMVKELRERTGLGMMECKKALTEAQGDMKAAEDLLRIRSGAKASKAATRVAAEGVVAVAIHADARVGALVEVNCETDFVAKNEEFMDFARAAAECVVHNNPATVEALAQCSLPGGGVLEDVRQALVMKLGENMTLRRFTRYETTGHLAQYKHGQKIGVLVDMIGGDGALGRDIAMHIAASKPVCVSRTEIPAELLQHEREIYTAQAAESGKPAEIIAKMVEGRVQKYLAEVTLVGQPFVKNPDQTVEVLLKSRGASVQRFSMLVVGEGIEKKVENFADEVAAAAGTMA